MKLEALAKEGRVEDGSYFIVSYFFGRRIVVLLFFVLDLIMLDVGHDAGKSVCLREAVRSQSYECVDAHTYKAISK